MMRCRNIFENVPVVTFVVAISFFTTVALAQDGMRLLPEKGKFSITPEAGTSFSVDGDFVKSASATAGAGGKFGPFKVQLAISGAGESQDFSDVFDQPIVVGVGVNYGLSSSSEIFGRVHYTYASGNEFDAITITSGGTIFFGPSGGTRAVATGEVIQGEFDDYHEIGFDAGYRHFFNIGSMFRPYASISGGFKWINDQDISFKNSGTNLAESEFFENSFTYAVGIGIGFRYDVSKGIAIGLETGIRYQGEPDGDDTDLAGGGFDSANDGGDRLDIPLMARVSIQL